MKPVAFNRPLSKRTPRSERNVQLIMIKEQAVSGDDDISVCTLLNRLSDVLYWYFFRPEANLNTRLRSSTSDAGE